MKQCIHAQCLLWTSWTARVFTNHCYFSISQRLCRIPLSYQLTKAGTLLLRHPNILSRLASEPLRDQPSHGITFLNRHTTWNLVYTCPAQILCRLVRKYPSTLLVPVLVLTVVVGVGVYGVTKIADVNIAGNKVTFNVAMRFCRPLCHSPCILPSIYVSVPDIPLSKNPSYMTLPSASPSLTLPLLPTPSLPGPCRRPRHGSC